MKRVDGIIEVPGMGQNLTDTVLKDAKNFTGDFMTDIVLLVDESTSIAWSHLEDDMKYGLVNIREDLLGSKNVGSMRVCVVRFGARVPKELDFVPIEQMDTSYRSHQCGTKLYEAICVANNLMLQHIAIMEEKNVYVNGLVAAITDGRDEGSENMFDDAKKAITTLRGHEVDFQMVPIGSLAIQTAYGLGLEDEQILKVEDTTDGKKLRHQWGQVSQSAKSASQRAATGSSVVEPSTAAKFSIDDD